MGYRRPKKKSKKAKSVDNGDFIRRSKGGKKVTSFGRNSRDYVPPEFNLQATAKKFRDILLSNRTVYEKIAEHAVRELGFVYEPQKVFYFGSSFYIVDIFIKKYKIVLEIDGRHHEDDETMVKDAQRSANLRALGIRNIIRINNRDCTTEYVKDVIRDFISELLSDN